LSGKFLTSRRTNYRIALFLAGIEIRIHVEDTLLRDRFGAPFEAWKMKIPAYLPLIR